MEEADNGMMAEVYVRCAFTFEAPNTTLRNYSFLPDQACLTQALNSDGNGIAITLDLAGDLSLLAPGGAPLVGLLSSGVATASVINSAVHTDLKGSLAGIGGLQIAATAPAAEYALKQGSAFVRGLPVVGGLVSAYATYHDGMNIREAYQKCMGRH
jgi:hypothetical protein